MDPAFWNNLPALLTALNIILVTLVGYFTRKAAVALGSKLDVNTDATISGQRVVYNKIESAQKEVGETVVASALEVKKEAVQTAHAAASIARSSAASATAATKEVIQQLAPIAERLNGGPGGLADLTQRMASLEAGHVEIRQAIDRMSAIIERR